MESQTEVQTRNQRIITELGKKDVFHSGAIGGGTPKWLVATRTGSGCYSGSQSCSDYCQSLVDTFCYKGILWFTTGVGSRESQWVSKGTGNSLLRTRVFHKFAKNPIFNVFWKTPRIWRELIEILSGKILKNISTQKNGIFCFNFFWPPGIINFN